MFRWLQGGGGRLNNEKAQKKQADVGYQELTRDQLYNPYNEVLILTGHISTVHQIKPVDENRFITASNDGLAIVWNSQTGKRVTKLEHKRGGGGGGGGGGGVRVVCVLPLQPFSDSGNLCIIMTADSLGVLHVWDLNVDDPSIDSSYQKEVTDQREVTEHQGMIKCLVQFNQELVCSGGSDLCLWDRRGNLLSKYDRGKLEEKSLIHSLLKLDSRHFGVVAASEYKSLAVYDISKSTMLETDEYVLHFVRYLLNSHAENICCLTSISANFFASGSLDGVILLWSTNSLSAMKMFHCADGLPRELTGSTSAATPSTTTTTEIRHILVIGERYLFAAIGCGFKVYDVLTYEDTQGHPKPLASVTMAHQQPITCMEFISDRAILATASEDNTVRLWGRPNKLKRDNEGGKTASQISGRFLIEEFLGIELNPQQSRKKVLPYPETPVLLGELLLHSAQVMVIMDLGSHGLVTCGADNYIILWKVCGGINMHQDADKEREGRDLAIRSFLHGDMDVF